MRAAREFPGEPAVDGAEAQFAIYRALPRARHLVQQPGELGTGEIRIQQQAGARRHFAFRAVGTQLLAARGGAAILPDDGVGDRLAGGALPQHRRFALVGDTDRGDVGKPRLRSAHDFRDGGLLRGPDFLRVVFHPAGLREMLREFLLGHGDDLAAAIEQDRARAGGALVKC